MQLIFFIFTFTVKSYRASRTYFFQIAIKYDCKGILFACFTLPIENVDRISSMRRMKMSWKRRSCFFLTLKQHLFQHLHRWPVEALACPLVNFLEALPHFEVQCPSDSQVPSLFSWLWILNSMSFKNLTTRKTPFDLQNMPRECFNQWIDINHYNHQHYILQSTHRQSPGPWCARSHRRIWSESLGLFLWKGNGSVECCNLFFLGAFWGRNVHFGGSFWGRDLYQKPMQQILMMPRDPKCLTFTVSERHELFRVLLQGAHAEVIIAWLVFCGWRRWLCCLCPHSLCQVEIPEIEFSIRPKAERRVDTIYNLILGCKDLGNIGRLGMDAISLGPV